MWRFNDFEAGQLIQLGQYRLTAEEIIEFGSRYDPQPMHTDPVAAPGVDRVRWLAPVRPGDTVSGQCRIQATRLSRSKPDRGVVTAEVSLQRQDTVEVLRMETTAFYLV